MTDLAMNREDLAANYFARRGDREFQAALKRLELRRSAEKAAETGGEAAVVGPRDVKGEAVERLKTGGRIALDVAHGIVEAPIQIPAGAIDAVNTSIDAVYEVSDWVRANSAPSDEIAASPEADLAAKAMPAFAGVLKKGSGQVADTPPEARLQLPIPADADSVTGGMIRGISRFVVGFAGAGKITKGVKAATATGKAAIAAGRGAMSDAAVFSAHEERLSDLVNQFPALQNPVTEYLASNPEDSAAEGRFKNALEGLIPGIAVDGLMLGLRAIRAGRAANVSMAAAPAKDLTPTFTREEVDALLSDRPKPKPEVVPAEGPLTPEQAAKAGQKAEPITAHHGTGAKAAGVVDDMLPSGGTSALEVDEGEVYVNWARIDTDKDVKALIRDMADAEKGEIDEATRGVVSNQETIENAAREDAWKLITERRKGEPLNAEQSFAVRKLWTASGEKLKELAELASTNPSDLNLFAFRRQMALHSTIQRQVIAARTETARALQQWAIPAGSDSEMARALGEIVEGMGGGEAVSRNMAEKVAKYARSGDLEKMEKFIEASAWAKTQDAVSSAWYFSLLSGPHTHMRNMVSNTVVAAQQIYERKAANLIGQMLGQENVARGEGMAQIAGTIEGIKDALRITSQNGRLNLEGTFYESMRTGQAGIGIGKLETPPAGAFSSEKWALDPESMEGRFMDMLDTVMSVPGRALMAEDELFKTIGYRRELHAQVHRKVRGEIDQGVLESTPEAIKDRTAELLADPDETLRLAAMDEAMYTTFTGQVGRAGKAFNQAANSIPVLGRIILPFRRTPVNIARYGFERTPLAPAVRQWREDIAAGGARRDIAMARMATGSALLLAMADLAVGGHIVGEGPDDPAQRATMRRQGVQPNSVRVKTGPGEDDYRYFSYRGMEPMAQTIGIAANIVEILKYTDWTEENSEVDELIVAAGMAIAYQSTSATYLTGMSDFFDAMGDPRRYGEKWFMRLAGSAVPTGVAQINRIADPNMRAVEDMIDAIKRRTPGLSKDLPYARDAWGKPIKYQSGIGSLYDAISPSYSKAYKPEPIDKELERLELWIGKPSKRVHFGAELLGSAAPLGIERSSTAVDLAQYPKAYDRYVELQGHAMSENIHGAPIDISGKGLLGTLNDLVEGRHPMSKLYHDYMTDGPEGGKAEEILTIRRKFQAAAREQILEEFPELREEVLGRLRKQQRSF